MKCDIPRLLTDQSYNTMIASAYIADRMDEFAGSYVLTLAGYNAGPGRARQWILSFGDPRDPSVDPPSGHDWEALYPRFADFRALAAEHDPDGKFRNGLLDTILGAPAASLR